MNPQRDISLCAAKYSSNNLREVKSSLWPKCCTRLQIYSVYNPEATTIIHCNSIGTIFKQIFFFFLRKETYQFESILQQQQQKPHVSNNTHEKKKKQHKSSFTSHIHMFLFFFFFAFYSLHALVLPLNSSKWSRAPNSRENIRESFLHSTNTAVRARRDR